MINLVRTEKKEDDQQQTPLSQGTINEYLDILSKGFEPMGNIFA